MPDPNLRHDQPRPTARANSARYATALIKRLDRAPELRSEDRDAILEAAAHLRVLPELDRRPA